TKNQTDTTTPTGNNGKNAAAQNSKPAENQTTTHGGAQRPGHNFNQSKNNRHQQTWHTIEFSNNRSLFQSSTNQNPKGLRIAPEQLFKLTGWISRSQIGKLDLIFPCGFLSAWRSPLGDQRGY
ncbi:hypothetical protein, partial [Paenarthrobacter aromaticivorans]|uniref:hypothetical protein n=1 Tax=Paenarthrobacter aromaticivorans TaxID=2849150 RepID=UPI003A8076BC